MWVHSLLHIANITGKFTIKINFHFISWQQKIVQFLGNFELHESDGECFINISLRIFFCIVTFSIFFLTSAQSLNQLFYNASKLESTFSQRLKSSKNFKISFEGKSYPKPLYELLASFLTVILKTVTTSETLIRKNRELATQKEHF